MFRILDRYIVREVLPAFAIGLVFFTFTLELRPLGTVAEKLIEKGVKWTVIGQVMATLLPQVLALTIPMALLIGLLVAFGRLSADREYVALQGCGISLYRLLWPAAILGLAAWTAASYVNIEAKPLASQAFRRITLSLLTTRPDQEIKPRVFFDALAGRVLYVQDVSPAGWRRVFLADKTQGNRLAVYLAQRGRLLIDHENRRAALALEDGTAHWTDADKPDAYQIEHFQELLINLDWEALFPRSIASVRDAELSVSELRSRISELQRQGVSAAIPLMELHQRFSIPAACFVFALVGVVLGFTTRRDGRLVSFILGIAIIFVYYIVLFSGRALTLAGRLPAWTAMWAPNVILGGAGSVLLYLRSRSVDQATTMAPVRLRLKRYPGTDPLRTDRCRPQVVLRFWRPRILDLYVTGLFLRVFLLTFLGLLGIFYIATFTDESQAIFRGTATPGMILAYHWYATPQLVLYSIPLGVLIGALVTIGILTKNSELVVMKACGVSLYRTVAPLLLVAVMASATLFLLQENVLAYSNRRAAAIRQEMRGEPPTVFDALNHAWMVGRGGAFYNYERLDRAHGEINGLSVYELEPQEWRILRRMVVSHATYAPLPDVSKYAWRARTVRIWNFGRRDGARMVGVFSDCLVPLEPAVYFRQEAPEPERMSYGELRRYIIQLQSSGFNATPYAVALQRKASFPFIAIIVSLIATPFGVTVGRRGTLYGVGVGIGLALAYWAASSVFGALGKGGALPPGLAAWGPNVLFGAVAVYLLLRVRT